MNRGSYRGERGENFPRSYLIGDGKVIAVPLVAGTYNDLAVEGIEQAEMLVFGLPAGGGANITITGLAPGYNGQLLWLVTTGRLGSVTLKDRNASSAARNRFICPTATDESLGWNGAALIWYIDGNSPGFGVGYSNPGWYFLNSGAAVQSVGSIAGNQAISRSSNALLDLVNSGVVAGTYPVDALHIPQLTIRSDGIISAETDLVLATATEFGDGSDGAVAFDGTNTFAAFATTTGSAPNRVYTLIRDIYASSITVSNGITVNAAGWRIFCTGALVMNTGNINNDGGNAAAAVAGAAAVGGSVAGGTIGGAGIASGTTTVAGSVGSNTNAAYHNLGGRGATGGNANGGAAGTVVTITRMAGAHDVHSLGSMSWVPPAVAASSAPAAAAVFCGGTGGGGGGRTTGGTATVSGAGGGGGGVLWIAARTIDNSAGGRLSANGGNGSNATGGTCATGGGAGGGGGVVVLIYLTIIAGTETAAKGSPGTGLNGGAAPGAASDGLVVKIVAV